MQAVEDLECSKKSNTFIVICAIQMGPRACASSFDKPQCRCPDAIVIASG